MASGTASTALRCSTSTPTPGNELAKELNALNRFSVTRQLHYSKVTNPGLSLDIALFINGLPVATFELKNSLTKQTVADAEQQYKATTATLARTCSS